MQIHCMITVIKVIVYVIFYKLSFCYFNNKISALENYKSYSFTLCVYVMCKGFVLRNACGRKPEDSHEVGTLVHLYIGSRD